MGNKQSSHCDLKTDKKTLFTSKVHRIPALLYERQSETLLAFAEQRKTSDDSGTEMLVMKTGNLKKEESSDVRTIEVIIPSNCFIVELLLQYIYVYTV